jgi:uncharacterized membrane protein
MLHFGLFWSGCIVMLLCCIVVYCGIVVLQYCYASFFVALVIMYSKTFFLGNVEHDVLCSNVNIKKHESSQVQA